MSTPVLLSAADHERVTAAVALAESSTSGEIVTIVTRQSDGYADVALAWAAFVAFTSLVMLAVFPDFYLGLVERALGHWNMDWSPAMIFGLAAMVAMAKFLGVLLLMQWPSLRFALMPGRIKTARTHARAMRLFRVGAESRTAGHTGVLIYLSMQEHRAEILADQAIASRVSPEIWGDAMAAMLVHIRQGRIADGMIAGIEQVGAVLAEHLPRNADDTNELPDRLIEL